MNTGEEEARERIIEAAMNVFSRYGFFRAPVKLVAMEAGVSKGLVFWYFKSKDELILEVAKRSLPADVVEACLEKGARGREALECVARGYLEKYKNPTYRNLLLHAMAAETAYPLIRERMTEICSKLLGELAERAYGERTPRNRIAVKAFFGALLCYVLRPPRDIGEDEFIENLLSLLMPG